MNQPSPSPIWAKLRQVVIATNEMDADRQRLADALRLGPTLGDPMLADVGLADEMFPIGEETYLELVTAIKPGNSLTSYVTAQGGPAGYCMAVQHPEPRAAVERAKSMGIRVAVEIEDFDGAYLVQFHPADCGVLLELDGITEPDRWFWDSRPDRIPTPSDAAVTDIVAVDIAVDDPATMAQRWQQLTGVAADGTSLDLSGRIVRFVPTADGKRGLCAVDLVRAPGVELDEFHLGAMQIRLID